MGTTYHSNDVGSVILDRPAPAPLPSRGGGGGGGRRGSHFKLWSASLRRIVLDAVRCGGQQKHTVKVDTLVPEPEISVTTLRSELKRKNNGSNATATTTANAAEVNNHIVSGSDKLSDLLRLSEFSEKENEEDEEEEVRKKVEALEELKKTVKKLQGNSSSSQNGNDLINVIEGAKEIRKLTKDDSEARTTLALLGAIPPLVALLDSPDLSSQIAALYALLNLGIGNDANKAAIVQAGAVHKILKLIESANGNPDVTVAEPIVANFLALSALDANKPIIGSSGALPFLVKVLKYPRDDSTTTTSQAKQDALRAVFNLSISPFNISYLLDANLVPFLLSKLGDMDMSERILSILSNIVSIAEGRKAISRAPDAFPILVDVLSWTDSPGCQEKVSYILMVMSHKGYGDRQAMVEAGVVSALLELTLLGSTLAQKRASRILEFITMDKGKQVSESYGGGISPTLSAPLSAGEPSHHALKREEEEEEDQEGMSEERKAVKQLVQQSLQNNMKRIVKRANLPHDFVPSDHFKSLTSGSTSKSLPF